MIKSNSGPKWRYWLRDGYFECCIHAHQRCILAVGHDVEIFPVHLLERTLLYARHPLCWELIECSRVLTVPSPTVLAHYWNLADNCHPSAYSVSHVSALESFTTVPVQFLSASEHGVFGLSYYDTSGPM